MTVREWKYPLHAGLMRGDHCEVFDGPFDDIDDLLNACFERIMAENFPPSDLTAVEDFSSNQPVVHHIPREAFPTDAEVDEAIA